MKKIIALMLLGVLCFSGISQNRGTLLKETFNNSAFPAGWTRTDSGTGNWSISNTGNAGGEPYELHLTYSPSFNGKSRVVSPVINTTGATTLVIEFIHYLDNYSGGHIIGIETTSNGGTTWNSGWQQTYSTTGANMVTASITTSDVGSANFQFCLFYQGNSYNMNEWYFDNIELYALEATDAAITAIKNPIYVAAGNLAAEFVVANRGTNTINSLEVEYQFGDLSPVVETFTSLNIPSAISRTLLFTNNTFVPQGVYPLKVNILKVNGVTDDSENNNSLEKTINIAITTGQRRVCIEHFTSSTCGPCVSVNQQMKTLLQNNPDKFGITKYQMSWPGSGDPYYTSEGGTRRTYYSVNAVPMVFFNGKTNSVNQTVFNNAFNEPAFLDIAGSFNVSGTTITMNLDIASYLSISSARIYVIVNEKRTTGNVGTNGELEFFHVMMKMLPGGQGTTTSFEAGEIKSFTFTQDLASTHVEEMSDLEVHVFVQNYATKYIYNSNFLLAEYNNILLSPPTNLALQDNQDNTITVTWDAPTTSTPNGYNIYLNGTLIQPNHTSTTYTATISQFGYQAFKVNAIYGSNVSVPVSGYIFTICSAMPTSLEAVQNVRDVLLTWVAPTEHVDSYNVYLDGTLYKDNITETTCTITGVPAGSRMFGLTSVTNNCESSMITTTLEVVAVDCAPKPENLQVSQPEAGVNNVLLTWTTPEPVDSYNIYLDSTLHQDNITTTTYTFIDVPEGKHTFGITSVKENCESEITEQEFTVIINSITEQEDIFAIHPNPVSGMLNIRTEKTVTDCQIFNMQGQLIYSSKSGVKEIATDGWSSGIYIIRISTDKGAAEKQFVKN
jgi:hypothetical protein